MLYISTLDEQDIAELVKAGFNCWLLDCTAPSEKKRITALAELRRARRYPEKILIIKWAAMLTGLEPLQILDTFTKQVEAAPIRHSNAGIRKQQPTTLRQTKKREYMQTYNQRRRAAQKAKAA
jgi:hypothetical protein